jgi:hypothetical protein
MSLEKATKSCLFGQLVFDTSGLSSEKSIATHFRLKLSSALCIQRQQESIVLNGPAPVLCVVQRDTFLCR